MHRHNLSRLLLSVLTVFSSLVILAQDLSGNDKEGKPIDRMHGERVLTNKDAPLINPICRFEDQVWFEITNLRPGKNLNDAIVMDFAMVGTLNTEPIHVVVLTNGSRHRFPVPPAVLKDRRGEIVCSYSSINDKSPMGAEIEAYVELTDTEPYIRGKTSSTGNTDPLYFKVSQSAVRGKVTQLTFAREIRVDELKIYTARKKKYGPPSDPPSNFKVVSTGQNLVPGTPVLASLDGDWLKAEVLGIMQRNYVIHWPEHGHSKNQALELTHIAINNETAKKLETNPESFKPSIEIPLNSLQPPEKGFVVLPDDLIVFPGVPVRMSSSNYTISSVDGDSVKLLYDQHARMGLTDAKRRQVCISRETIARLKKPDAEEFFAERLKKMQPLESKPLAGSGSPFGSAMNPNPFNAAGRLKRYPIRLQIPPNHSQVDEKTPLKQGTTCFVNWGHEWSPVTVQQVAEDAIQITWNGWGRSAETISRSEMIISDAELKKLKPEKSPSKPEKAEPKAEEEPKAKPDQPAKFKLILKEVGKNRSMVIRGVMKITELDLKTVGELIDELPLELSSNLTDEEAKDWKSKFEKSGASVSIEVIK